MITVERITGPHHGFYLASYACEGGPDHAGYLGFVKICRHKPDSYSVAQGLVKICGDRFHPDAALAVVEVEQRALRQVHSMLLEGEAAPA